MPELIIMPPSEVADRYTIAKLKLERLGDQMDPELREEFEKQVFRLKGGLDWDDERLVELTNDLYDMNAKQWDTEGAFRAGLLDDSDMAALGRLAIEVRDINCARNRIKNLIVEHTGQGWKDVKMNYGAPGAANG